MKAATLLVVVSVSACGGLASPLEIISSLRLPSAEVKQMVLHCRDKPPTGDCSPAAGAAKVNLMKGEFP